MQKHARRKRDFVCSNEACAGQRINGRRCACGARALWLCPGCLRRFSASNISRHESLCAPLSGARNERTTPQQSLPARAPSPSRAVAALRVLWILREGEDCSGGVVLPADFAVPKGLEALVSERRESTGERTRVLSEYDAIGAQLQQQHGHQVTFLALAALRKAMASSQEFDALARDYDLIVHGNWPYDLCDDQEGQQHAYVAHLERVQHHYNVRCLPSPADARFLAHKHLYHGSLARAGFPVAPTVYLDPADASLAAITEALSALERRVEPPELTEVMLKRGVSEAANHAYFIKCKQSGNKSAGLARSIKDKMDHYGAPGCWWLLQPFLPAFTKRPELKLYFDASGALAAAFAQRFCSPSGLEGDAGARDIEIQELRQDLPAARQRWQDLSVDRAASLARRVRDYILGVAPSIPPLIRVDLIETSTVGSDGFLVNEVEHFGNAWLLSQNSGHGFDIVRHFADSVAKHLSQRSVVG